MDTLKFKTCFLWLASAFFLCSTITFSQPWLKDLQPAESNNFFEIQKRFYSYWADKDTTQKGIGWKQFKRWEWFWQSRVDSAGNFPPADILYRESQKINELFKDKSDKLYTSNWQPLGPSQASGGYWGLGRINCIAIHPSNQNVIYVGSAGGGIWKSTNGGNSWFSVSDNFPTLGISDIAIDPNNASVVYAGTGDYVGWIGVNSIGILKSTNAGASWFLTGMNYNLSQGVTISRIIINPNNSNIVLTATNNGIWRSTNGGSQWTQVNSTGNFIDMEFKPNDPNVVYASTRYGGFFRSTDGGITWTQITEGLPTNGYRVAIAVTPANVNYVYLLTVDGSNGFRGLYRSTNSGISFTEMSTTPNILSSSIDGSGTGGQGWYDLCLIASPVNANLIIAGGVNLWRSTNGGSSWFKISHWYGGTGVAEVHADQHYLFYVNDTTLYVTNDGGVYRTTNSGTTWTWLTNGMLITQFYRIAVSATNPNVLLAGAQDNSSWKFTAPNWSPALATGDGMEQLIDYTNSQVLYTSSYYGSISRSTNGGVSWNSWISQSITGENGAWITPYLQHPSNPQLFFAGFQNVWKTTNSGQNWTRISDFGSSATLTLLAAAPSNPNVIFTGHNTILYKTTDGGTNWTQVSLPFSNGLSYVLIHPTNPQVIWITRSGFQEGSKVYKSTNGGGTWINISGSLPNVPANCLVYQNNSNDIIYLGTDIGVFYRDASLNDWIPFNNGLPNVVVSELEIQYSSAKLRAATYGRGVWETSLSSFNVIAVNQLSSNNFNLGQSFEVPYSAVGNFGSNNVFIAQISDSIGNFQYARNIGYIRSSQSGVISAVIPANLPPANGYRVRVISSNIQDAYIIDNGSNIVINPSNVILYESFESTAFPPSGWQNIQNAGTGLWDRVNTGTNPTCAPVVGTSMARFNSYYYSAGTIATLISTPFSLAQRDSVANVRLWMYRDNGYPTSADKIDVYINTVPSLTGAFLLGTINRSRTLPPVVDTDGWYQYIWNIPLTFNSSTNYLLIKATSQYGNNIFIDDILITTNQRIISVDVLQNNVYCLGDTLIVPFFVSSNFNAGNTFTLQLSNPNGSFSQSTTLGSKNAIGSDTIICVIPNTIIPSINYKIRVNGSNPPINGIENNVNLILNNGLITNEISKTQFCRGESFYVKFSLTNCNFINSNSIISVQLSDQQGSFNNPVIIGTRAYNNIDSILCTIPTSSITGNNYRIRVVASNPNIIGTISPSIISIIPPTIITNFTENSINVGSEIFVPFTALCIDTTLTYTAQLSNSSGSFVNPTNIGTAICFGSGVINCVIPANISAGNGYRIRVVCNLENAVFIDNGFNITIYNAGILLFESFEGDNFPPNNWQNIQNTGVGIWGRVNIGYNPNCNPKTGNYMAIYNSYSYSAGTSAYLVTRPLNFSNRGENLYFRFWMYRDNGYSTYADSVTIFVNTQPTLTNALRLGRINRSMTLDPVVSSVGWYEYTFNIPSIYSGNTNYIIILGTSQYGNNIFIDDILVETQIPIITTGLIANTSISKGTNFQVPFYVNTSFNQGNVFTAQLSDSTGSFNNPVIIGTLSGTNSGTINCVIPDSIAETTGYKIRVIASNPQKIGIADPQIFRILPNPIYRAQDSLALVAIYNNLNGANWINKTNWLTSAPIDNWYGVKLVNTRVDTLNLAGNNLVGLLPNQVGNLTYLKVLNLANNQISGFLTSSLTNLQQLRKLNLNNNKILTLPNLTLCQNLLELNVGANKLQFSSIEQNLPIQSRANGVFIYSPQDSVGQINVYNVPFGSSLTLNVSVTGQNNRYRWYRNGVPITNLSTNSNLTINPVTAQSVGEYICEITNTQATQLTLYSRPQIVQLSTQPLPANWTFTSNTGRYANIVLVNNVNFVIAGRQKQPGDALGVFFTRNDSLICGGYLVWNGTNMSFQVWGDNPNTSVKDGFYTGEQYTFKVWDGQNGVEYPANVVISSGFNAFYQNATTYISSIIGLVPATHNIYLQSGWSLISSYVTPSNNSIPNVLNSVLDNLVLVKNSQGLLYFPPHSYSLTTWNPIYAYALYMLDNDTLSVTGTRIEPQITPIIFNSPGWYWISYLRNNAISTQTALQSIAGNYIIIKNMFGDAYFPPNLNTLPQMVPGFGYMIYMTGADTLIYPSNNQIQKSIEEQITPMPKILTTLRRVNLSSSNILMQFDDDFNECEVGVWNSHEQLIGSGVIQNGICAFTIYGVDEKAESLGGARAGELLNVKMLDKRTNEFHEVRFEELYELTTNTFFDNFYFLPNAIYRAKVKIDDKAILNTPISAFNIYPNPAYNTINIEFNLVKDAKINLHIEDLVGRTFDKIFEGSVGIGIHRYTFNTKPLPSGTYFIVIQANNNIYVKPIIVLPN